MDESKQLIVLEWRPDAVNKPRPYRFPPTLLAGTVATALIHILMVCCVGSLVDYPSVKPPENVRLGNEGDSDEEDLELLPAVKPLRAANEPTEGPAPIKLVTERMPLRIKPPAAMSIAQIAVEETPTLDTLEGKTDADLAAARKIYLRQIRARIEAVWATVDVAARASDPDDSFKCEVQLEQDDSGNVREVLLLKCSGSLASKGALITAIRQASPLPAANDPRIFRASLVIEFDEIGKAK